MSFREKFLESLNPVKDKLDETGLFLSWYPTLAAFTTLIDGELPSDKEMESSLMNFNMAIGQLITLSDLFGNPYLLASTARLKRNYFDALMKEGFTAEQAIQIVCSHSPSSDYMQQSSAVQQNTKKT